MCNAAAMLAVTAFQAFSQVQQGQATRRIYASQAAAVDDEAQRVSESGSVAEQTHRLKVQQLISTQTAAAGASGADVSSQSFGNVMDQAATTGELDALTIRMNAQREAWGLKTRAQGLRYQGRAAEAAGVSQALGTALTGFASAYGVKTQAHGWFKA